MLLDEQEMPERLYDKLLKLPKQVLLEVLLEAIDEMRSYNGQPIKDAIFRAIGAKPTEDGKAWKVPSNAEIRRQFK